MLWTQKKKAIKRSYCVYSRNIPMNNIGVGLEGEIYAQTGTGDRNFVGCLCTEK